jgi:hypothetical protein
LVDYGIVKAYLLNGFQPQRGVIFIENKKKIEDSRLEDKIQNPKSLIQNPKSLIQNPKSLIQCVYRSAGA